MLLIPTSLCVEKRLSRFHTSNNQRFHLSRINAFFNLISFVTFNKRQNPKRTCHVLFLSKEIQCSRHMFKEDNTVLLTFLRWYYWRSCFILCWFISLDTSLGLSCLQSMFKLPVYLYKEWELNLSYKKIYSKTSL